MSQKPLQPAEVEAALVPTMWRPAVFANRRLPAGAVDRDAYVLCLLDQLRTALRRRDVFAHPSLRWSDPRARLLDGADWLALRDEVLAGLGLAEPANEHLAEYAATLDAAWRLLAQRIEEAGPDASVRIAPGDGGRMRLSVEKLEALGEPPSLVALRKTVAAMLPRVDLPELLMEVHSWTGCFDEYVHVGDLSTRIDDLPVTIAALLVAEACNVGLTPVIRPGEPALTGDRLSHVDQNYVRAETHAATNARLIETQAGIEIAGLWGAGLLPSRHPSTSITAGSPGTKWRLTAVQVDLPVDHARRLRDLAVRGDYVRQAANQAPAEEFPDEQVAAAIDDELTTAYEMDESPPSPAPPSRCTCRTSSRSPSPSAPEAVPDH